MGLKRWPLKPNTSFVSPSPAGPAGSCPWDWVIMAGSYRWRFLDCKNVSLLQSSGTLPVLSKTTVMIGSSSSEHSFRILH